MLREKALRLAQPLRRGSNCKDQLDESGARRSRLVDVLAEQGQPVSG